MQKRAPIVTVGLVVGMLGISVASIFIRLADAPPLAVAAYRLGFAVVFLLPLTLATSWSELRSLSLPSFLGAGLAGVALALHFWTWIASLGLTTVASSVVLQTSHPILVAAADRVLFREELPRIAWLAAGVTVVGSVIVGYGDMQFRGSALAGDLLAVSAAVFMAVYLLIGRRIRRQLSTLPYTLVVYSSAATFLLGAALLSETRLYPYSVEQFGWFLGLAIVPTLFGHSVFNWALRYIPTTGISISVLSEPVGAAILAWFILDEVPTLQQIMGGALILVGILAFLRSLGKNRRRRKVAPIE